MSTKGFASALAKAQAELTNAKFDRENTHFRNKYATLTSVRDTVVPVFARHGIAVMQNPIVKVSEDGKLMAGCETVLRFEETDPVSSMLVLPVSKPDAQGVGAAITYARRYSLMGIACITGEDDDDANEAVGLAPQATRAIAAPRPQTNEPPSVRKLLHNEILAWAGIGPNDSDAVRDFIRKAATKAGVTVNGKTMTDAEAGKVLAWVKTQRDGNVDAFDATGGA